MVDVTLHRRGYGSHLLANSEQQLFNRGITTIRLETFEGHSQAINFYNKNGWSVTGIQEDKDHGFNMILFEKKA